MGQKGDLSRFIVRTIGRGPVPPRTTVRRPKQGGQYDGHPNVKFHGVTVQGVDFRRSEFDYFEADGTRFEGCDFSGARIEGLLSPARQTSFESCTFDGTRLRDAQPGQARFVRCDFVDTDLWGWSAVAAEFVDCRFRGRVRRCKFWGKPWGSWLEPGRLSPSRTRNEFRGNDFGAADLEDVGFAGGIDLSAQVLPVGPQYVRLRRSQIRIERAKSVVSAWPPGEDRAEALVLLDSYTDDEVEAQDELFANRWETDVPQAVAARVWSLLESMDLT